MKFRSFKSSTIVLLFVVAICSSIPACKTTEKNYRQAYERTMTGRDTTIIDYEQTVYGRTRRQMRPTPIIVGGDTLDARVQWVRVTDTASPQNTTLKPYMIVAGEFKQLFNARSMRERLNDAGYTNACVVETSEPFYYVIALTAENSTEALLAVKQLRDKQPFPLRPGMPYVLRPAGL